MAVRHCAAVGELDLLRSAINPSRADPEPQVDPLLKKMGVGPKRQPVRLHLAFKKGLG